MSDFSWTCPYCQHMSVITDGQRSTSYHDFNNNNENGLLTLRSTIIVCPNPECKQYTVSVDIFRRVQANSRSLPQIVENPLYSWLVKPQSRAKSFPSYIPQVITRDYEEACLICNLSPKASATLSRRCLQGIIRDFWGISKNRLIDEIAEIQDKVDPLTWQAIDAIRKIGNIGAHMEKDINIIVDVEPQEAKLLIALIEVLFKDWYIARYEREQHLQTIINVAASKEVVRKSI
ncbi:DUF4145 domain-containing protein [Spirosoma sp. KNUC1025]|uniref:DUF4145 domain-containing protein n=1 Tax=Spirosoma sp. KNUC1025 TaxID=2894082 RepID=UPI0038656E26|nr:DUF4145 domain-containing protein [Spirosoma sp. KNUC1025]